MKLKSMKSKGFTIIELLVVVAIIAILTGIVLVNVSNYTNRSKNDSIKGNLSTILTNSAVWFEQHGDYTGFTNNNSFLVPWDKAVANQPSSPPFYGILGDGPPNTVFCACLYLNTTSSEPAGTSMCIDSRGTKVINTVACATKCDGSANWTCH